MAEEQRRYRSYLLRLWWAGDNGETGWRASLEEPHTGCRRGFASLDQLFAFLEAQTANGTGHDMRAPAEEA